jgi:hypothetical protein
MLAHVNRKWSNWLPYVFIAVAALSRWPNLFPPNFSAFYGLAFCAGAFFSRGMKWWLPMGTLVLTDLALNLYYLFVLHVNAFNPMQLVNYAMFLGIIWFGGRFNRRSSFVGLLSGGIIGAILFYLITNTAAWFINPFNNPEYVKTLTGWIIALTKGTSGYPTTIQFFLNTLMSGGLFTGLFAGAMKLTEAAEPEEEKEEEPAEEEPKGEAPDEAGA